jgi:hypothetical protein
MNSFLEKHADKTQGTLSCFDRVIFKGYLPISSPGGMAWLLDREKILIKDFKTFVQLHSRRIQDHADAMARETGRPKLDLNGKHDKEKLVRKLLEKDPVTQGLICILSSVEGCQSFRISHDRAKPRPELRSAARKCLCLYFYYLDPQFGLMYVRLQTWFPLTVQIYVNGHSWLARKMDRNTMAYRASDNAFSWLGDPERAQRFADRFVSLDWPKILMTLARRVCPLFRDVLQGLEYYWVMEQAEFSTDVMFRDHASLADLYEKLLRHASLCFSAEDILRFLGRKLDGRLVGEFATKYTKRWPGARISHRAEENAIKMYDKHGVVLRIETVINCPYRFRMRRWVTREGRRIAAWVPMRKGVSNLFRYAEVSRIANHRYLEAMSVVDDPAKARHEIHKLCQPAIGPSHRVRGLNPLRKEDAALFAAVLAGEHAIQGFRNPDIRQRLFGGASRDPQERRRQSAFVTRQIQLLRAHGLVAKISRTRRYRPTKNGLALMAAAIYIRTEELPAIVQRLVS